MPSSSRFARLRGGYAGRNVPGGLRPTARHEHEDASAAGILHPFWGRFVKSDDTDITQSFPAVEPAPPPAAPAPPPPPPHAGPPGRPAVPPPPGPPPRLLINDVW